MTFGRGTRGAADPQPTPAARADQPRPEPGVHVGRARHRRRGYPARLAPEASVAPRPKKSVRGPRCRERDRNRRLWQVPGAVVSQSDVRRDELAGAGSNYRQVPGAVVSQSDVRPVACRARARAWDGYAEGVSQSDVRPVACRWRSGRGAGMARLRRDGAVSNVACRRPVRGRTLRFGAALGARQESETPVLEATIAAGPGALHRAKARRGPFGGPRKPSTGSKSPI